MYEYVKICPKCEHVNPETSDNCSKCGEYFFNVIAVPPVNKNNQVAFHSETLKNDNDKQVNFQNIDPRSIPITSRETQDIIYLDQVGNTKTYEIRNGWVLGQAHSTSDANVQLTNINGLSQIHRQHCLFDFCNGQWFVTALVNKPFTNSSFLNQIDLNPDQKYQVQNGDKLTLSKVVTFNIRIV